MNKTTVILIFTILTLLSACSAPNPETKIPPAEVLDPAGDVIGAYRAKMQPISGENVDQNYQYNSADFIAAFGLICVTVGDKSIEIDFKARSDYEWVLKPHSADYCLRKKK